MTVRKISVSLPSDMAEQVDAAAARAGLSLSAWLARSASHSIRIEQGLDAVAEWEAEHGAFTAADLTRAAGELADLDAQMARNADRLAG
jgi:Arc/MetJ-type ribon-helix-helix transcriptional regulator